MNEDYRLLDVEELAGYLATEQFKRDYEDKMKFQELYEQVDETGSWYLRQDYQSIFNFMEDEWRMLLEEFEQNTFQSLLNP
jgi:RNA binding exosome subunit